MLHPTLPPSPDLEAAASQTLSELITTRSLDQSTRRIAEYAITIGERAKRLEEAGFAQLAAVVRTTAESTLMGFLVPPIPSEQQQFQPPPPAPRLGRKPRNDE
jgi:Rad3-related DNA helicase